MNVAYTSLRPRLECSRRLRQLECIAPHNNLLISPACYKGYNGPYASAILLPASQIGGSILFVLPIRLFVCLFVSWITQKVTGGFS